MQVNANIDEADIGNISEQVDVRFTVDAYPNETFRGRIAEIRLNPQTVQNVVTYSVILSIDNPDMKLKPGMTANITITVDQRNNVLKVPNAALRYTPAGVHREELTSSDRGLSQVSEVESEGQPQPAQKAEPAAAAHLAPGQKWDPEQKIRFVTPRRVVHRPGVVFVLDAQQQPQPRKILLGITDGSATEVVSGDVKPGDAVIVGDNSQVSQSPNANVAPPFLGGFGRGGGGGGRGRGN
jgi:HlyD family secretion protein